MLRTLLCTVCARRVDAGGAMNKPVHKRGVQTCRRMAEGARASQIAVHRA